MRAFLAPLILFFFLLSSATALIRDAPMEEVALGSLMDEIGRKPFSVVFFHSKNVTKSALFMYDWVLTSSSFRHADNVQFLGVDTSHCDNYFQTNGEGADPDCQAFVRSASLYPMLRVYPSNCVSIDDAASSTFEGRHRLVEVVSWIEKTTKIHPKRLNVVSVPSKGIEKFLNNHKKQIVLLEFYAMWCGHCLNLANTYEELATVFSHDHEVVIAKYDSSADKDVLSQYSIKGFPTILAFGKATKKGRTPVIFNSAPLEAMVRSVNQLAGTERDIDGGLLPRAGRVKAFDALIKVLVDAKEGRTSSNADEALAAVKRSFRVAVRDDRKKSALYESVLATYLQSGLSGVRELKEELEKKVEEEPYKGGSTDRGQMLINIANVFLDIDVEAQKLETLPVLPLTQNMFEDRVGKGTPYFVEFYAPWCGHCKSLAPIWEQLGQETDKSRAVVAKVDGTEERSLMERFSVTGFPTLLWFDAGSTDPTPYSGQRTLEDLKTFVADHIGASSKEEL